MNIHNILKVYKRDLKSIIINPVAIIIIAGLCIIPSLYAWINIEACWNTYENTSTIPVAVVNNDTEVNFNNKKIGIGNDVIKKLKTNHKIDWIFVNSKQANMGLVDGTYYAMIEIPKNFSSSFLTILSDNPQKPQITYKVDTKVNPVAGKITNAAKNTLVSEITSSFVSTVNETIFSSLNIVGKDADDNKDDIIQMKDSIININRNMDTIQNSLQSINSNSKNISQFLSSVSATMPSVQSGLGAIKKNNTDNQAIMKSTQATLDSSINNIDMNLNYAQTSNSRIKDLFHSLNESVSSANSSKTNSVLPGINTELDSMESAINATIDYLEQCNSLDFNGDIDKTITSLKNLQNSLIDMKKQLIDIQKQIANTSDSLDKLYDYLDKEMPTIQKQIANLNQSLGSTITALEDLNKTINNADIANLIDALKQLQSSDFSTTLSEALVQLKDSKQQVKAIAASLDTDITNIIKEIDSANSQIDTATVFLQSVKVTNNGNKAQISNIIVSLKEIQPYIRDEKSQFSGIQQQLIATNSISKNIANSVNDDISKINTQLISAMKQYNLGVRDDLNSIGRNLILATQDASDLIQSAQDLSSQINSLISTAQNGSQLASGFSSELNSKLLEFKDVIKQLSNQFELVNNNDLAQIIGILQSNPKFMGELISNPFTLENESINEIPNYGSSMTPIYTTLALWVGCLLLNSILRTKAGYFKGIEKLTLREKHFGKMMIYSTLAIIQGIIVSLGDILILHVYTVNAPLMVSFAIVSSLTFSIITYTLTSTLGNVGKALGIIYMILQLAGSGGTYPIQVDPMIFRILQPFFPFTYCVGGFREAIAGPLVSSAVLDFIALFTFAAVFLLFGFFFVEPLYKRVHSFEVKFKESGVGE